MGLLYLLFAIYFKNNWKVLFLIELIVYALAGYQYLTSSMSKLQENGTVQSNKNDKNILEINLNSCRLIMHLCT